MNRVVNHVHKNLLLYISFILNIIFAIAVFFNMDTIQMDSYINSDTLYLSSFYQDLFLDNAKDIEWITPAATCFFPDLVIFFIAHFITSNFILAMFISGLVFNSLLILALYRLLKEAVPQIPVLYSSLAISVMLLFHLCFLAADYYYFSFYLTITNYHLGAFFASIFSLSFIIRYLRTEKWPNLLYGGIIYALTLSSDFLTIFNLVIPFLSLNFLFLIPTYRSKALWIQLTNLTSFILGYTLYRIISFSDSIEILDAGYLTLNFDRVLTSYQFMLRHHLDLMKESDFQGLVFGIAIITTLFLFVQAVVYLINIIKGDRINKKQMLEIVYVVLTLVVILSTYNGPALNGLYISASLLRYNVYALFIAVFNFGYIIYKFSTLGVISKYIKLAGIIILIVVGIGGVRQLFKVQGAEQSIFHYYPDDIANLDKIVKEYNLKYGLASYWYARRATLLSAEGARIYQVYENMRPYDHHVANRNWYFGSKSGSVLPSVFKFVIPDNLTDTVVFKKLNGHILDTVQIGKTKVILTDEFILDRTTREPTFLEK